MKITIFGSTGGTGLELVKQGLDLGHDVIAFARTPSKLDHLTHENLRIVRGDVLQLADTCQAIDERTDAVLSALGNTLKKGDVTTSAGTKNIIEAMDRKGTRRFVCETSLGVGDSYGQPGFVFTKIAVPLLLKHAFADKEIQERNIRESDLQWVVVRPGALTNGEKTSEYRHGLDKDIKGKISRADVAEFMLKQLDSNEYLRKTPAICY